MIAIIYYQKLTLVGVISIVLSLLSVSTKSLIFSAAITFKIFIFNWLSLVIDFFGIFCSLSFVFYNYNINTNTNTNLIINWNLTEWSQIWIFQSIIMWGILCVGFGLYAAPHILTESWHDISRNHHWSGCDKICNMTAKTIAWCFMFIASSVLAFLATNIALFAPIALVCDIY